LTTPNPRGIFAVKDSSILMRNRRMIPPYYRHQSIIFMLI